MQRKCNKMKCTAWSKTKPACFILSCENFHPLGLSPLAYGDGGWFS